MKRNLLKENVTTKEENRGPAEFACPIEATSSQRLEARKLGCIFSRYSRLVIVVHDEDD
jgi:hypothetical protein